MACSTRTQSAEQRLHPTAPSARSPGARQQARRVLLPLLPPLWLLLLLLVLPGSVMSFPADVTHQLMSVTTYRPAQGTAGGRRSVPMLSYGQNMPPPGAFGQVAGHPVNARRSVRRHQSPTPDAEGTTVQPDTNAEPLSGTNVQTLLVGQGDVERARLTRRRWPSSISAPGKPQKTKRGKHHQASHFSQRYGEYSDYSTGETRKAYKGGRKKDRAINRRTYKNRADNQAAPVDDLDQPVETRQTFTFSNTGKLLRADIHTAAVAAGPLHTGPRVGTRSHPELNSHDTGNSVHHSAGPSSAHSPDRQPWLTAELRHNMSSQISHHLQEHDTVNTTESSQNAPPPQPANKLTRMVGNLKQFFRTMSGSSGEPASQPKQDLSDVIQALTHYHLVRGSLSYTGDSGPGLEDRYDPCHRVCSRSDVLTSAETATPLGGVQTTATIVLWAMLAATAAWVGPAVSGGRLFTTRSDSACDNLADFIDMDTCLWIVGLFRHIEPGVVEDYVGLFSGEAQLTDSASDDSTAEEHGVSRAGRGLFPLGQPSLLKEGVPAAPRKVEPASPRTGAVVPATEGAASLNQPLRAGRLHELDMANGRVPRSVSSFKAHDQSGTRSERHDGHADVSLVTEQSPNSRRLPGSALPRDPESYTSHHTPKSDSIRTPVLEAGSASIGDAIPRESGTLHASPRIRRASAVTGLASTSSQTRSSVSSSEEDSTSTGRGRNIWSRMSSAATWLPRTLSGRLRTFGRWLSPRRSAAGQQQHGYAAVDRSSSACACSAPPRKNYRQMILTSALAQFLSTSFWIPALGLVYLLGLSSSSSSSSNSGGVTVTDNDSVTATNNDPDTLTNTVDITVNNMPVNTNTATQTSMNTVTTTITDNSMNTNNGGDNTNTNNNTNNGNGGNNGNNGNNGMNDAANAADATDAADATGLADSPDQTDATELTGSADSTNSLGLTA